MTHKLKPGQHLGKRALNPKKRPKRGTAAVSRKERKQAAARSLSGLRSTLRRTRGASRHGSYTDPNLNSVLLDWEAELLAQPAPRRGGRR